MMTDNFLSAMMADINKRLPVPMACKDGSPWKDQFSLSKQKGPVRHTIVANIVAQLRWGIFRMVQPHTRCHSPEGKLLF